MNNLIILCNPKDHSFCESMAQKVKITCERMGIESKIHDIYKNNFYPVLTAEDLKNIENSDFAPDVQIEHDLIRWSNFITFIFPIYWAGMPALMKGYVDRVLCKNFAYKYVDSGIQGLLTDKKVFIFNSFGNTYEHYHATHMFKALERTMDQGIFQFCGIKILNHSYFGAIHKVEPNIRDTYLAKIESILDEFL